MEIFGDEASASEVQRKEKKRKKRKESRIPKREKTRGDRFQEFPVL